MTSQPVQQTITIQMLPSISCSKSNQTIKFRQAIEYNKDKNQITKNHAENKPGGD